jgi:hypothetical protein
MRVVDVGAGDPEVAVVGGIHGDEPCGVAAVERLIEDPPDVDAPVRLVIANEAAIAADRRYVDEDLNRAFPASADAGPEAYPDTHEGQLAREVVEALRDCLVLALHSTQSHPDPFAIVDEPDPRRLGICTRLPVGSVVESGPFDGGRLLAPVGTVEVECGLQGSERATENAHRVTDAFLRATGVLPGPDEPRVLPLYRLQRAIPKSGGDYEVFVENFVRVAEGQAFASEGGRDRLADADFYPVLLSAEGYEELFGYAAARAGTITPEGDVREDDTGADGLASDSDGAPGRDGEHTTATDGPTDDRGAGS